MSRQGRASDPSLVTDRGNDYDPAASGQIKSLEE
jgi:hypothetical protein